MDPILFFDEVDKVSDTARGDELLNALVHVTDPVQNHALRDRYLYGLDLDLSASSCSRTMTPDGCGRRPPRPRQAHRGGHPRRGHALAHRRAAPAPQARKQSRCTLPMDTTALQRVVDVHAGDPGMRGVERSLADVMGVALVCDLLGNQSPAFGEGGAAEGRARSPLTRIDVPFVDAVLAQRRALAGRAADVPPPGMYS